ncbi:hypothetical protein BYT27DRAFT_7260685 [Phlegmacium glaucopus]|nr:hypothetical protein BYT27DRAFT_7260685 [Phlegmacium glaucopus]
MPLGFDAIIQEAQEFMKPTRARNKTTEATEVINIDEDDERAMLIDNSSDSDIEYAIADHPHIKRMTLAGGDLVITANDIYSWNVEQAGGKMAVAHNIVDVVKREKGLDVQGAFDFVEGMYLDIQKGLLDDLKNLPTFEGPENEVLKFYVEGLVEWVQGNVEFSLASGRYFRDLMGNTDIRKTRLVAIYPGKHSLLGLWVMLKAYFAFFMAWLMSMIQRCILLRYKQL